MDQVTKKKTTWIPESVQTYITKKSPVNYVLYDNRDIKWFAEQAFKLYKNKVLYNIISNDSANKAHAFFFNKIKYAINIPHIIHNYKYYEYKFFNKHKNSVFVNIDCNIENYFHRFDKEIVLKQYYLCVDDTITLGTIWKNYKKYGFETLKDISIFPKQHYISSDYLKNYLMDLTETLLSIMLLEDKIMPLGKTGLNDELHNTAFSKILASQIFLLIKKSEGIDITKYLVDQEYDPGSVKHLFIPEVVDDYVLKTGNVIGELLSSDLYWMWSKYPKEHLTIKIIESGIIEYYQFINSKLDLYSTAAKRKQIFKIALKNESIAPEVCPEIYIEILDKINSSSKTAYTSIANFNSKKNKKLSLDKMQSLIDKTKPVDIMKRHMFYHSLNGHGIFKYIVDGNKKKNVS